MLGRFAYIYYLVYIIRHNSEFSIKTTLFVAVIHRVFYTSMQSTELYNKNLNASKRSGQPHLYNFLGGCGNV